VISNGQSVHRLTGSFSGAEDPEPVVTAGPEQDRSANGFREDEFSVDEGAAVSTGVSEFLRTKAPRVKRFSLRMDDQASRWQASPSRDSYYLVCNGGAKLRLFDPSHFSLWPIDANGDRRYGTPPSGLDTDTVTTEHPVVVRLDQLCLNHLACVDVNASK
jgi:hypothetical protein